MARRRFFAAVLMVLLCGGAHAQKPVPPLTVELTYQADARTLYLTAVAREPETLVHTYSVRGDHLTLRGGNPPQALQLQRLGPRVAGTSALVGEWGFVHPVTGLPARYSFRRDGTAQLVVNLQ